MIILVWIRAALFVVVGLLIPSLPAVAQDKARNAEQAAGHVGTVWQFPDLALACQEIAARVNKSRVELRVLKDFNDKLKWAGPAIATAQAAAQGAQGKYLDAGQTLGNATLDYVVCAIAQISCPAWAIGRTAGGLINFLVSSSREDGLALNDLMGDVYIDVYASVRELPATISQLVLIQRATERGIARREELLRREKTCRDPAAAKPPVAEIIQRASPVPRPATPAFGCEVLKNTAASESLAARDPAAYDELLLRCL